MLRLTLGFEVCEAVEEATAAETEAAEDISRVNNARAHPHGECLPGEAG